MKNIWVMIGLSLGSLGARADGVSDWLHIGRSFSGYYVSVDYRIGCYTYSMGQMCVANPLWLNVYGVPGQSSVTAVLINQCPDAQAETRKIDLYYDSNEHKYTGDLPYGTNSRINGCYQELAVKVNADWSTKYNGGKNFSLDLMNAR